LDTGREEDRTWPWGSNLSMIIRSGKKESKAKPVAKRRPQKGWEKKSSARKGTLQKKIEEGKRTPRGELQKTDKSLELVKTRGPSS